MSSKAKETAALLTTIQKGDSVRLRGDVFLRVIKDGWYFFGMSAKNVMGLRELVGVVTETAIFASTEAYCVDWQNGVALWVPSHDLELVQE